MIPRAQRAYELYLNNSRQMAAAYPQVLIGGDLFQLQQDYITALVDTLAQCGRKLKRTPL